MASKYGFASGADEQRAELLRRNESMQSLRARAYGIDLILREVMLDFVGAALGKHSVPVKFLDVENYPPSAAWFFGNELESFVQLRAITNADASRRGNSEDVVLFVSTPYEISSRNIEILGATLRNAIGIAVEIHANGRTDTF